MALHRPVIDGLAPRFVGGTLEIPVWHARGGTSTGIVLLAGHLPVSTALREEVIRNVMGVPLSGEEPGNRQITGLGRGITTSNKVFILDASKRPGFDLESTLAQLAAGKSAIDWSVNCGNMSASLPLVAFEAGLARPAPGRNTLRILNTNTGIAANATIEVSGLGAPLDPDTEMPGVMGRWPGVALSLVDPVGSKTGKLFPTGCPERHDPGRRGVMPRLRDADGDRARRSFRVPGERGTRRTGTGRRAPGQDAADLGRRRPRDGAGARRTPDDGGRARGQRDGAQDVPHRTAHGGRDGTGRPCSSALFHPPDLPPVDGGDRRVVPGGRFPDPRHRRARRRGVGLDALAREPRRHEVGIGNPAGVLRAAIDGAARDDEIAISSAAYMRSAQILIRGHTPIYHASPELIAHYRGSIADAAA